MRTNEGMNRRKSGNPKLAKCEFSWNCNSRKAYPIGQHILFEIIRPRIIHQLEAILVHQLEAILVKAH